MKYFKQEDFNKCVEFLKGKPATVKTQQELHKFMHEDCRMMPDWTHITSKNMNIYSKVYLTCRNPNSHNWCNTMSDGSQVVWNRKYQEFYTIDRIGSYRCSYLDYTDVFTEITGIDKWLLENWSTWRFQETQKQLVAIWNGKYDQFFRILMNYDQTSSLES